MKNPNVSVQPLQGRQLPPNWRQQASRKAEMAEIAYTDRLTNAWRGSHQPGDASSLAQGARLTRGDCTAPSHPPHSGAIGREDRSDGIMKKIYDDDQGTELWQDQYGNRVWRRLGKR